MCQKNQAQIDKDNILQNIKISYYDYKPVDKLMMNNKAVYLHTNKIPLIMDHLKSHKCGPMAWSH